MPSTAKRALAISRVSLLFDFILCFVNFARLAGRSIDQPGQLDHRIFRRGNGGRAAGVELFANSGIFEFASGDELSGAIDRRFAGENLLTSGSS